jgi:pimeloyl-ACP methyl ester carboxylesterase
VVLVAAVLCASDLSAAKRKVDVGGYKLSLHCTGQGQPTVVLDAGAGDSHDVWSEVQPAVSGFTRVCSYDRAGLGRSDPGPLPRTSRRIVEELHTLLDQAGIDRPVVVVGHSFGGLNARLFASVYPDDVCGLVLVEATHESYAERSASMLSGSEAARQETLRGVLSPAARSELESVAISGRQLREAGPLPGTRTIVMTAGRRDEPRALSELWRELQDDIAVQTDALKHVIAEKSGHCVQFDRPGLVVEAIRDLVRMSGAKQAQGR